MSYMHMYNCTHLGTTLYLQCTTCIIMNNRYVHTWGPPCTTCNYYHELCIHLGTTLYNVYYHELCTHLGPPCTTCIIMSFMHIFIIMYTLGTTLYNVHYHELCIHLRYSRVK
uniref:Uncharacterized protein n=1 Tax=Cacopsylla melanoneura TaxID=428564 RepID=A0A8D8TJV9_9HEMI